MVGKEMLPPYTLYWLLNIQGEFQGQEVWGNVDQWKDYVEFIPFKSYLGAV